MRIQCLLIRRVNHIPSRKFQMIGRALLSKTLLIKSLPSYHYGQMVYTYHIRCSCLFSLLKRAIPIHDVTRWGMSTCCSGKIPLPTNEHTYLSFVDYAYRPNPQNITTYRPPLPLFPSLSLSPSSSEVKWMSIHKVTSQICTPWPTITIKTINDILGFAGLSCEWKNFHHKP